MLVPVFLKALACTWPISDHFPIFFPKTIDLPYQKDVDDNRGRKHKCYFNLKFSFHEAEVVINLRYNYLDHHA